MAHDYALCTVSFVCRKRVPLPRYTSLKGVREQTKRGTSGRARSTIQFPRHGERGKEETIKASKDVATRRVLDVEQPDK